MNWLGAIFNKINENRLIAFCCVVPAAALFYYYGIPGLKGDEKNKQGDVGSPHPDEKKEKNTTNTIVNTPSNTNNLDGNGGSSKLQGAPKVKGDSIKEGLIDDVLREKIFEAIEKDDVEFLRKRVEEFERGHNQSFNSQVFDWIYGRIHLLPQATKAPMLLLAMYQGAVQCVQYLVGRKDANVNQIIAGKSMVHWAVQGSVKNYSRLVEKRNMLKFLVEQGGAEINCTGEDGKTPLDLVTKVHKESEEILFKGHCDAIIEILKAKVALKSCDIVKK